METKNKIVKTAKVCQIITKVLYILSFAVCLTFIALAIALPITEVIKEYAPKEVAMIFSTLALYSFICIGLLWNVEGIFKSIVNARSPFCEGVNHYLKKTAIYVLVISVVPALLGSIILKAICSETELTFPISVIGIVAGAVLFLIGMFFKYGSDLQKQDDETL